MTLTRALGKTSRTVFVQFKNSVSSQQQVNYVSPLVPNHFRTFGDFSNKTILQRILYGGSSSKSFGFSTSASAESNEKESGQPAQELDNSAEAKTESADAPSQEGTGSASQSVSTSEPVHRRRKGTKRIVFSDSDSDEDMDDFSKEDLWKMTKEKEQLLLQAQKEVAASKDTVLHTYAEMENVRERMRRESDHAKKYAIQNFAKSLLDVADNLNRASSVDHESFSKIDTSEDTAGVVPYLKTLLEGVGMTEKQLAEVFKKYGVEKYDPTNEPFDPNLHNAVLQVPDNSKSANTVALVFKPGYVLHDRVLRPAEVGVAIAAEGSDPNQEE